MKQTVTLVAVVLDESGSMQDCKQAAISGVNEFISQLKNDYKTHPEHGRILFTLTTLSGGKWSFANPTGNKEKVKILFNNTDIREIDEMPESAYNPQGGTPLLEGMGKTIEAIDAYIAAQNPSSPNGVEENSSLAALFGSAEEEGVQYKVVVVTQTDGGENESDAAYLPKSKIGDIIKQHEARGNWTFVYLGADFDAIGDGITMNIAPQNALNFAKTAEAQIGVYNNVAVKTSALRGSSHQMSSRTFFTDEDKKKFDPSEIKENLEAQAKWQDNSAKLDKQLGG